MTRIPRTLLYWTLLLCACAPIVASTDAAPASAPPTGTPAAATQDFPDSPALPIPSFSRETQTPVVDAASSEQCVFQWAQQAMPELTTALQESIQLLQPEAQARAFAFGENCTRADGTVTLLPMETDFDITLQVSDLADESELGAWIVKVMEVIENIPPAQIVGPRPGRVSLVFQSNGEQADLSFYIDQYRALPAELDTAQIYQALQIPR
jgi:hypothetical protein